MSDEIEADGGHGGPVSSPVRQLVSTASDEQLAWMVGPDRRFYSAEALDAASVELERRRLASPEPEAPTTFNIAAFVFGPLWYFYHGLIGRGLMISAVWLGAFLGLEPVADALGIPALVWILAVVVTVGAYCSRFADRDLAESATQARMTGRRTGSDRDERRGAPAAPRPVVVAEVGCRAAGEQAKTMLEAAGIRATVECDAPAAGAPPRASREGPARVLVPAADLARARALVSALLASAAADRCLDD